MLFFPLYLIRKTTIFNFSEHAISHLGTLKKTAKNFCLFLLAVGVLEYAFFLTLLSHFGIYNFPITTPILSVTAISTIVSALISSKNSRTIHFVSAALTFFSAGLGGFLFSIEYAHLTSYSVISILGIIVSFLLFLTLVLGIKRKSLSAYHEFIFIFILCFWNIIYTFAIYTNI
jgi:hypothetical protein